MNKTVKFKAAGIYNTWPKTGYLFENGWFLCEYYNFNRLTLLAKKIENQDSIWYGNYQKFEPVEKVNLNFNEYLNNLNSKGLLSSCPKLHEELINANKVNNMKLTTMKNELDFYSNSKLSEILEKTRKLGIQDVENKCIPNEKDIKYIVVGDNPGKTELIEREYFIGYSGQQLRSLFERENLVTDFQKECIVFNKTVFSTPETLGLENVKNKLGDGVFNEVLRLSAEHVLNVQTKLNVPILIFGKSELQFGKLLYPFWEYLKNNCTNDAILIFSHPSHGHFENEWNKNKNKYPSFESNQLLKFIGRENYKGLM